MDGGDTPYYWIAAVLLLGVYLIIEEYKRDKQ
jgi:hypothetical protein